MWVLVVPKNGKKIKLSGVIPCKIGVSQGKFESCHPDNYNTSGRQGRFGMWRSLVAHTHGVRGVAGSNPVIPTYFFW